MKKEYNSLEELYLHVLPALRCKKHEMQVESRKIVKEADIWSFLRDTKWKSEVNLTLAKMVDDILNTDNDLIIEYTINKLRNRV